MRRKPGSVASPTAGLHFTPALLNALRKKGHGIETVTLHVNLATFRMVEAEDITQHKMHTEEYSLTRKSFGSIQRKRQRAAKIVAVGKTSSRVLETISPRNVPVDRRNGYLYLPGYTFRAVDILITNFHLPRSTLIAGLRPSAVQLMKEALRTGDPGKMVGEGCGDAMIIL